ncbi:DUF2480 family protein [Nonlabens agnitus]|uniref:DUF2480 family protein n=1 Tax=Nonlabens agnitus TaxID=870484 RepID=A0A2S9WWT4_9FLAO|nr:DUF2480 family protein [Nonlabens agnitus]PRP67846.1 hypothetical protein BST86_12440 [Nonlabens agnitus]
MREEIINRVANSKLKNFDLEDYYVAGPRTEIDISQWLMEGLVLMETRFRESVKNTDFTVYKNHHVALNCSTDAIVPPWAWMLLQSQLTGIAETVVLGTLEDLETHLYRNVMAHIDLSSYKDLPVIVKGCSKKPVPVAAYLMITEKLQGIASSVMYGEACSSVPVYKKRR